jgi:hypothetical protein
MTFLYRFCYGAKYPSNFAYKRRSKKLLEVSNSKLKLILAHLGYALMPYRLDTYDAMASLAVTSDASTNRRSVATPTPSGVHLGGVERRP